MISTKTRICFRPIIVGWFHTILKNSKNFRVDSNGMFAEKYMNCWVVFHVRVFATLGAYNTIRGDPKLENGSWPLCRHSRCCADGSIVPGPMPLKIINFWWFDIFPELRLWRVFNFGACRLLGFNVVPFVVLLCVFSGVTDLNLKLNFSPLCYRPGSF